MSIQVKEIAFVFHSVTDVARARKFYEELLGLEISSQTEFTPGQWWVEYDIAGQALAISNAVPGKPSAALALEVADLDATLQAAVKAAGVTLDATSWNSRRAGCSRSATPTATNSPFTSASEERRRRKNPNPEG